MNEVYKKTWSEEFKKGWHEGYLAALDEVNYKISTLISDHYEGDTSNVKS